MKPLLNISWATLSNSSKGSFVYTIPQTFIILNVEHWLEQEIALGSTTP